MSTGTLYAYHGEMLPLAEITARAGLSKSGLYWRMRNHNCGAEEAVAMILPGRARKFTWIDGRELTLKEISEITGVSTYTIDARLRVGIPFLDACTKKSCKRRDYKLDVVPRHSEAEKYMMRGEVNQRAAKAICKAMLGVDPRKLKLREVNYWYYRFDTDHIAFEIMIMRDVATCTGRIKEKDSVLIERKYKIGEDGIKEVTYG